MSVKDVIKKSILESDTYNQAIGLSTIAAIAVNLLLALIMGLVIYRIYRRFYRGVVYSKNYAMSLIGMTVLTCMVTLAISTNIIISLGMVGALSIVRFRTAIKEPLDLMYMFWAITCGIALGASMYILVAAAALIMYVLLLVFDKCSGSRGAYILVVHYRGDEAGDEIIRELRNVKHNVRSRILRGEDSEMTVQLKCRNKNMAFVENIRSLTDVSDVALLDYNGEYHG